ncbi:hypothetical protein I4U23_001230 [Adineta vaga]|nr:hypothetical protein I4U23_001230 [Adineta vaga]
MSSRAPCISCENIDSNGIFKCEGCSQTFCLKHTNEHRFCLDYQLERMIDEHETIFHLFNNTKQQSSLLFDQINQWEIDSITKIKQISNDTREKIQQLAQIQKQHTKDKFNKISKELENARTTHEYLEKDLYKWKIQLEQLHYDITSLSPTIILHEKLNSTIIKNISVSKVNEQLLLKDSLVSDSNHIQFDDQHHIAMHCGPKRTPCYVTGTQEYLSGQYQIRLFISKKTSDFSLSFNIISKSMEKLISSSHSSEFLTYGWQSDDCVNPSHCYSSMYKYYPDFKGQTKFHLELFLDCDNHKIRYFNEKTKREREIDVDLDKCPLPWKLHFYLYDIGDSIRLLSSIQIS